MTDFYSQNRCVCSTRSHGPLLCAFCLSFHFKNNSQTNNVQDNHVLFLALCSRRIYLGPLAKSLRAEEQLSLLFKATLLHEKVQQDFRRPAEEIVRLLMCTNVPSFLAAGPN